MVGALIATIGGGPAHAEHGGGERERDAQEFRPEADQADTWDVVKCTALAEAVAVLVWYAPAAFRALGRSANAMNTKVVEITGVSKEALTGFEMIASVIGLRVMPKQWLQFTLDQFFEAIVKPLWSSCEQIGSDFASLPSSLGTLLSTPSFHQERANDSIGVRNGRYCARQNLSIFGTNWFGGGFSGCQSCCNRRLTESNGLAHRRPGCIAVCHAQFD